MGGNIEDSFKQSIGLLYAVRRDHSQHGYKIHSRFRSMSFRAARLSHALSARHALMFWPNQSGFLRLRRSKLPSLSH